MFREIQCTNPEDMITLSGQFRLGSSECLLPVRLGKCHCKIEVIQGKIQINHQGYDMFDCGCYCLPPVSKQPMHYKLTPGKIYTLDLTISHRNEKLERVEVVNPLFFGTAVFSYVINYCADNKI